MENEIQSPIGTEPAKKKLWPVVIGLVIVAALAAGSYYFGVGDLFKGQIKLTNEQQCKKIFETYSQDQKVNTGFKRCQKHFPDLLKTVIKDSKPVVATTFDNTKLKIWSMVNGDNLNYINGGTETMAVSFYLPTYNDADIGPKISLPFVLQLCFSGEDNCKVLSQQSIELTNSDFADNKMPSGTLYYLPSKTYELVNSLGLKSGDKAKLKVSVKEPPDYLEVYSPSVEVVLNDIE